jgi:hypothetical protein
MSGEQGQVNDNPLAILPGKAVHFPNPAINPYGTIQRVNGSSSDFEFVLPANGLFEVTFQVGVQNAGELVVVLNGNELLMTVVGKPGSGIIVGISIISTPANTPSILSINNPSILSINNLLDASQGGLKIDEATGALSRPLSCHLIIKQIA